MDVVSAIVNNKTVPAQLIDDAFADHTFFLQPHFAWERVAQPRIDHVEADTGFAQFGAMMVNWCGEDGRGHGNYPFVRDLYAMFVGELCPPEGVLSAWSAQFAVSRQRMLANPLERYVAVANMMEAPKGHWLHDVSQPQ